MIMFREMFMWSFMTEWEVLIQLLVYVGL